MKRPKTDLYDYDYTEWTGSKDSSVFLKPKPILPQVLIFLLILSGIILGLVYVHYRLEKKEVVPQVEQQLKQAPEPTSSIPSPCALSVVICKGERLARVTQYGRTGHKMANGEYPYVGVVATSDRTIPLGTKVTIAGKEYTIKDRTASWIDDKFGFTLDVFSEHPQGMHSEVVRIQ